MKKEGLTWLSRRTSQLRYGINGQDQWVQPLSVYEAGEDIKRGHAVSIATPLDISELGITAGNVVVKTNSARHLKVVGIASETVLKGESVHVQPFGLFKYGGEKATADEYTPFLAEKDYLSSIKGHMVYVSPVAGEYTVLRDSAVLGQRNVLQLGLISNTQNNYPEDGVLEIELQFEGDGRGPLGHTQYELNIGEPFSYAINSGIKPVKAFAIGDTDEANPEYSLKFNRPALALNQNGWVAVYNSFGALFVTLGNSTILQGTTDADKATIQYIESVSNNSQTVPLYTGAAPVDWYIDNFHTNQADMYTFNADTSVASGIIEGLRVALETAVDFSTNVGSSLQVTVDGIEEDIAGAQTVANIKVAGTGLGPIYVAWDSSLDEVFLNSGITIQGSYSCRGKAVLADARVPARSKVIGLMLQDTSRYFNVDDPALFIRKGLYTTTVDTFTAGSSYYLGMDGNITEHIENLQEGMPIVPIGIARDAKTLIVDIGNPQSVSTHGERIGTVRPMYAADTMAHYGYLLMDGSAYSRMLYPELVLILEDLYGSDAINDNSNPNNFIVPELRNIANNNFYEIKATKYATDPYVGNCVSKTITTSVVGGALADIDITHFLYSGPTGDLEPLGLQDLVVKMFVKLADGSQVEIPVGYSQIAGSTYGYTWQLINDGLNLTLVADIADGDGIRYISGSNAVSIDGLECTIRLYKPELFNRFSDFDLDVSKMTLETIDVSNNPSENPVSSLAVSTYISDSVDTAALLTPDLRVNADGLSPDGSIKATAVIDGTLTVNGVAILNPVPQMHLHGEAPTVPGDNVISAEYVEQHRAENITADYPVHGIMQGHENGFDADTLDTMHRGYWGSEGPDVGVIPFINSTGHLDAGNSIGLHVGSKETLDASPAEISLKAINASTAHLETIGTAYTSLGIGNASKMRYILNNDGVLEFTDRPTPGGSVSSSFIDIKASAFVTASSQEYKENIKAYKGNALDILHGAQVSTFNYKSDPVNRIGLIAEHAPKELVAADNAGIDMSNTVAYIIKAIQELASHVDALDTRLGMLNQRFENIIESIDYYHPPENHR